MRYKASFNEWLDYHADWLSGNEIFEKASNIEDKDPTQYKKLYQEFLGHFDLEDDDE